jgi:4-hydroxy-tetrahydrodipicolinate synthase
MATAIQARDWAPATLRGIGNSLYTPFCGDDGDDIDWDAYRTLVRYCVGNCGTRCCGAPAGSPSSGR